MTSGRSPSLACVLAGLLAAAPTLSAGQEAQPAPARAALPIAELKRDMPVDFEQEILPFLRNNCLACHNQTKAKAGLVLETPQAILKGGDSGPAAVPGKGADSLVLRAAAHQIEDSAMPPRDNQANARNLTPRELALLKLWIDQGAKGEVRGPGDVAWQPLPEGLKAIYAVALSADGQFAACARGNEIAAYHLPSGQLAARLADPGLPGGASHRDLVQSLAFSPDGELLASGSYREVKLWRRPRHVVRARVNATNAPSVLAASPDGQWLALGLTDGAVQLVSSSQGRPGQRMSGHDAGIRALTFSPDSARLLTLGADHRGAVWSVPAGELVHRFALSNDPLAVAWCGTNGAAASRFALGEADGVIRVYSRTESNGIALERVLQGHSNAVTALAAVPDVKPRLLSGGADGVVRLWDMEKGETLFEMRHGGPVTCVAARPDGRRLASCGPEQPARLWNAQDGKTVASLKGDRYARDAVASAGRHLVMATNETVFRREAVAGAEKDFTNQTARVARATATNEVTEKAFAEKQKSFQAAQEARSKAENSLAALHEEIRKLTEAFESADQAARQAAAEAKAVSERATQARLQADQAAQTRAEADRIAADTAAVAARAGAGNAETTLSEEARKQAAKMAEDAAAIAAKTRAFAENTAREAESRLKAAAEARTAAEKAIETVASRAFLAGQARVPFDRVTAEAPEKLKQATNALDSAGKALAEAEKEFKRAETLHDVTRHELELAQAGAASTSNALASAKSELTAAERKHQQAADRLKHFQEAATRLERPARAVAFSTDGLTLATVDAQGVVRTWSAEHGAPFESYGQPGSQEAPAAGPHLAWAGGAVASLAPDGTLTLWEPAPAWTLERTLGGATNAASPLRDRVMAVRFSPDGTLLATGGGEPSRSGEIHLWRVAEGALWKSFPHVHSDAVLSLDFTPDGGRLASGAADRFARVTGIDRGKVIRALEGHTHHVTGVSWKSDGRTLMTAGADNVVKIWNTLTGERKKNVDGFNKEVTSVQFMGLGDQAVAASGDGQVRLINEKGERVRDFPGATDYVNAVLVTPDGQVVAAGGQDGVLRVWDGAEGRLRNAFAPPAER